MSVTSDLSFEDIGLPEGAEEATERVEVEFAPELLETTGERRLRVEDEGASQASVATAFQGLQGGNNTFVSSNSVISEFVYLDIEGRSMRKCHLDGYLNAADAVICLGCGAALVANPCLTFAPRDQGRVDEAGSLFQEGLEQSRRVLGDLHPETLNFCIGLRASPELIGPGPTASVTSPSRTSPPAVPSEFAGMDLKDLQARKRDLKQQLKQYDMNFSCRNGRIPVKTEREPIRHLYESYNSLKFHIAYLDQYAKGMPSPVANSATSSTGSIRAVSPPSGSERNNESPVRETAPSSSRSISRKLPRKESPPVSVSTAVPTPYPSVSNDLAALKTGKQELHQMLRSYEKDFLRKHNRQVSIFVDIKPVAPLYRRYKEIKKAIAGLQEEKQ